jgi:hypothetical protein
MAGSVVTFSPRNAFDDGSVFDQTSLDSKHQGSVGSKNMNDFLKNMDYVQHQQVKVAKKLEAERKRSAQLDELSVNIKNELKLIQNKTRNGTIIKEDELNNKKLLTRLEHQLQTARVKLSVIRRDNRLLKTKIDETRKDKLMHVQIVHNLDKELESNKRKTAEAHKLVALANDKKHHVQIEVAALKHKMVRDMEDFGRELSQAKQTIQTTQGTIMESIKDRLELIQTFDGSRHHGNTLKHSTNVNDVDENKVDEIEECLREINIPTVEELVQVLHVSEEQAFFLYNEIQADNKEFEKLETINKHLERELSDKNASLLKLEQHNEMLKQELETNINTIQKNITKYDLLYVKRMDVLNSISESLMNLLQTIAIDEDAMDQQLLSTGLTDRNINEFLGLIEQRIDDLIQMSKAAARQTLKKEDFLRTITSGADNKTLSIPALPSLENVDDDDDEKEDGKVQPINIGMLKDYMQKKIQSSIKKTNIAIPLMQGTFKDRMTKNETSSHGRTATLTSSMKISSPEASSPGSAYDPNGILASIGVNMGSEIKGKKGSNLQ